jgi:tellurite methyltransferase
MTTGDREKWDRQHSERSAGDEPSSFLKEILESEAWQIPRGRALDIATGKGRNALYLAERGFDVVAIDTSAVDLAEARARAAVRSLRIDWQEADLELVQLPTRCYQLIINFNYLQRSLVPQIMRALEVGGFVLFETYLVDQQTIGHPKNPAYLLEHNELLELFRNFRVFYYREGKFLEGQEIAFRAGILAQKVRLAGFP